MILKLGVAFAFICLLYAVGSGNAQNAECKIPESWHGNWFQSLYSSNLIEINDKSFDADTSLHDTLPGQCQTKLNENQYIFVRNIQENKKCTRCLNAVQLHENAIRYSQSQCMEDLGVTVDKLCFEIPYTPDETFYMFRDNPSLIECPFRPEEQFQMTYTKIHKPECSHQLSTAQTCFNKSQMLINFEACIDNNVSAKRQKLSCVAKWNGGTQNYFAALVYEGNDAESPMRLVEKRFRCFAYTDEKNKNSLQVQHHVAVAVSEEPTCSGLSDAESGETNLKLFKSESCEFPRWFVTKEWHTLDHQVTMSSTLHGQKLTSSVMYNASWKDSDVQKMSCIQTLSTANAENNNTVTILAQLSSEECEFKSMCLMLSRLTEDFTLSQSWIQNDQVTSQDFKDSCFKSPETMNKNEFSYDERTLISKTGKLIDCPHPGIYKTNHVQMHTSYTDGANLPCSTSKFPARTVEIGCSNASKIAFIHDGCDDTDTPQDQAKHAECYGSWVRSGEEFLVIQDPYEGRMKQPLLFCISISNDTTGRIHFNGSLGSCRQTYSNEFLNYWNIGMTRLGSCDTSESDLHNTTSEDESQPNGENSSSAQTVSFIMTFSSALCAVFLLLWT